MHSKEPDEEEILFGSWHLLVLVMFILFVNFSVIVYVTLKMKRQASSQLNERVNSAVHQYVAINNLNPIE